MATHLCCPRDQRRIVPSELPDKHWNKKLFQMTRRFLKKIVHVDLWGNYWTVTIHKCGTLVPKAYCKLNSNKLQLNNKIHVPNRIQNSYCNYTLQIKNWLFKSGNEWNFLAIHILWIFFGWWQRMSVRNTCVPSLFNTRALTLSVCPFSLIISWGPLVSITPTEYTPTAFSVDPQARIVPGGLIAKL